MSWILGVIGFFIGGPLGFLIGFALGYLANQFFSDDENRTANPNFNKDTVEPSIKLGKSLIEQIYPCIDIVCHYALLHEPTWNPDKVNFVKNIFIEACENDNEIVLLRERIKLTNRPTISQSIRDFLALQPNEPRKAEIYINVMILIFNTCRNTEVFKTEALQFGSNIGLERNYCIEELENFLKHVSEQEKETPVVEELNERELAAKVLGISVHASIDEIKKAHRIKIRDFHSDRNVGVTDAVREILEQKAAEINHARDVLLKL
ncbi:Dna-J like membrane chaperone protein [Acinetobacter baumannii]|uniref:hypothetical protein n=1 Tax=Acinetobacter baumannii TaxID=470 RepID=UPI000DE686AD|nr:hypothetical protein [Acinetobacter baumannii]MBJ9579590.1 hypothetical protein [Acinetobacter baumannii]SSS46808.1 Dna-J like membrane chaperone protein [Acinetobacter baumannii]